MNSIPDKEADNLLIKLSKFVPGMLCQFQLFADGRSCFPFASEGVSDIYRVTPEEIFNDASIVFTRIHPDDLEDTECRTRPRRGSGPRHRRARDGRWPRT